MKNIVVVGNSVAGISCAKTIRDSDKESKITIISEESRPGYLRYRLFDFFNGRIKESELFFPYKDFYMAKSIELLLNKRVVNIDERKKRIYFKDSGFVDFDVLVLACGRKPKLPEIKGITKKGVFSFYYFNEVKEIIEMLPIVNTVAIIGSNSIASQLVSFFSTRKIDTKWFSNQANLENNDFIEIISGSSIAEILGNGDVKAIRLSNNKVIGVNLIIFTDNLVVNTDLVKDTSIAFQNGILVDNKMSTNIENIFAAGDVAQFLDKEKQYSWLEAEQEGITAGRSICQI